MVYRERKGPERLRNTSVIELEEFKPKCFCLFFGSNRQVNFGFQRLRRWTPASERKLEWSNI